MLSKIKPNIDQPRKKFSQESLLELSKSIKNQGLLVPIIVSEDKIKKDNYIIVAGERRWRAAKLAGLKEIHAIISDKDEKASSLASIIENVQREDLNSLEEAEAYKKLIDNYKMTHQEISKYTGKSRSYVSNLIRILNLPANVKSALLTGKITYGHARTLIGLNDKEISKNLEEILNMNLSVRQTEEKVKIGRGIIKLPAKKENKDINILDYEKYLSLKLGYQVIIKDKNGKGSLSVKYKNLEQLDAIIKFFNT